MPSLLLVRHGQASFGAADYDVLSERGHAQSALLADRLATAPPAALLHGTMRRQADTAAALHERWPALAPQTDGRLDEYDHEALVAALVEAEGEEIDRRLREADEPSRAFQDVLELALARWGDGDLDAADVEPYAGFRARVRAAVTETLAALGSGEQAVAVSSGGAISAVCADLLGLDAAGWRRLNRVLANASITRVVAGRRGTSLVTVNDYAHLEHDPPLVTYR